MASSGFDKQPEPLSADEDDPLRARPSSCVDQLGEANRRLEEANRELAARTQELEAAKAEALAAVKVKASFLANMSHELRTPLTALLGFVDVLGEEGTSPQHRVELIESIRRNGEHLLALVGDILDMVRAESVSTASVRETFSPQRLADKVVDLLRHHATGKGLSLTWRADGVLPELVSGDVKRIRQVMLNLVGNAIKFTEDGSVEIVLRLSSSQTPIPMPLLEIEVRDTGIGIESASLAKLFEPFSQADSSDSRRFGGSGLGLALCRRLAETMGGGIDVASELGKGSVFRAWFEIQDAEIPLLRSHAEKLAMPALARCEGRILVVDDGPDNRKLIAHHLTKAGARVETAENGLVGVQAVARAIGQGQPFDLIVLDMQMPVMDGWTAATNLREGGLAIPILALTANAMPEVRQRCLQAGCTAYMSKPVDRAALLSMCAALISPSRSGAA